MDPKNIKLTFWQKLGPAWEITKRSEFVQVCILAVFVVMILGYMSYLLPVIVVKAVWFDIIIRMLISALVIAAIIGLIALIHQIYGDLGEDWKSGFRRACEQEMFRKKKKILDNIIEDEILK